MASYVPVGVALRKVRVSGVNLFQLAATYLHDATQWYRIAQLNGLSDPWIIGIVELQIPTPSSTSNGGILGL